MSNKKRNKKYRGRDAALEQPVVKRYKAEPKSTFQLWLDDNRQNLKIKGVVTVVVAVILMLLFGLAQLIF